MEHGVDLNARDAEGNTALFHAKDWGWKKVVKILENNGATL